MSSLKAAMYAFERAHEMEEAALELLRVATADSEPAPFRLVILRAGQYHRAFAVEGIAGYWTREECNLDAAASRIVANLSDVRDESELCGHCFGPLEEGHDDGASDVGGVPV